MHRERAAKWAAQTVWPIEEWEVCPGSSTDEELEWAAASAVPGLFGPAAMIYMRRTVAGRYELPPDPRTPLEKLEALGFERRGDCLVRAFIPLN